MTDEEIAAVSQAKWNSEPMKKGQITPNYIEEEYLFPVCMGLDVSVVPGWIMIIVLNENS